MARYYFTLHPKQPFDCLKAFPLLFRFQLLLSKITNKIVFTAKQIGYPTTCNELHRTSSGRNKFSYDFNKG